MGVEGLQLTPGSLRAGHTTQLFLQGWTPQQLMYVGRWVSHASLTSYIQEAMSLYVAGYTQHIHGLKLKDL
eukprot:5284605-Karenia_brevis.AAC.1